MILPFAKDPSLNLISSHDCNYKSPFYTFKPTQFPLLRVLILLEAQVKQYRLSKRISQLFENFKPFNPKFQIKTSNFKSHEMQVLNLQELKKNIMKTFLGCN